MEKVPRFALSDLARIPLIGWKRSYEFVSLFKQYQRSLRGNTWSCLTSVCPRCTYSLYYYLLFWWGEYCGVLDSRLLTKPDLSLIGELFMRYFIEIDSRIDCPKGASLLRNPSLIKNDPTICGLQKEILKHIWATDLPRECKRDVSRKICEYRRGCLSICREAATQPDLDLAGVLHLKEMTVGSLWELWANLLGMLYCEGVSPQHINTSQQIVRNAGMALQVMDDMLDLPIDYASDVHNIFYHLLKETPVELRAAIAHLSHISWKHLDWAWARQNLPTTCKKAAHLIRRYLGHIAEASLRPDATSEVCRVIGSLSRNALGVEIVAQRTGVTSRVQSGASGSMPPPAGRCSPTWPPPSGTTTPTGKSATP